MKRGGYIKRKALPKRSKRPKAKSKGKSLRILSKKLWELCKAITRARYVNKDGTWNCFTCGSRIDEPSKAQTGHFIHSSIGGIELRYNLDNLRIQDYRCNINLGGNGSAYYLNLLNEIGQERIDALFKLKFSLSKADELWYTKKIAEYQKL